MKKTPFRRITKLRSADSSRTLKAGIIFIFTGFTTHILFFESLIIILNLDQVLIGMTSVLTGVVELDMLIPLLIITLSPIFLVDSNFGLFFVSLIPWLVAGFITGFIMGPGHDRAILLAPPLIISIISLLAAFLLYSLLGGLIPVSPFLTLLSLLVLVLVILFILAGSIAMISFPIIIPALIGYSIGKKYTPSLVPQLFFAQPDRQDPHQTRCKYLNGQNQCGVGKSWFIPNTCDNKYNQVTCNYFTSAKMSKRNVDRRKRLFLDEIQ
jgi:hypothetical protein